MAADELEDLPRHEKFTRGGARRRMWWPGRQREHNCSVRMRRYLRAFVGRSWSEARAALDRFCAAMHEDAYVVGKARDSMERALFDRTWYGRGGIRLSEGRLEVDGETGTLRLHGPCRRQRTYAAAEVRPEPMLVPRGKRGAR